MILEFAGKPYMYHMSMTEQRRVDALASWSYVDSRPAGVEGEDLLNLSVTDSKPKSVRCVCVCGSGLPELCVCMTELVTMVISKRR